MATSNFPMPRQPRYSEAFPEDLLQNNRNYYTDISIMSYGFGQQGWGIGAGGMSLGGSIKLPIPKRINDVEVAVWAEQSATQMGGQVLYQIAGMAGIGSGMVGQALQSIGSAAAAGVGVYNGVALNPFMFMQYQRPAYKEYDFSWILTPSNPSESQKLKSIIDRLKLAALPGQNQTTSIGSQSALLDYPSTVQIAFKPDDYLFKLKTCAILAVMVDYTASGMPSFFKGTKAPTFISLSLKLKEIEIQTKNNYAG